MAENKSPTVEARIHALEQTVDALQKENHALKKMVQREDTTVVPEKPVIPSTPFMVGDRKFQFLVPRFMYRKQMVSATDALATPDILADLVAKRSGLIKEIY